MYKNDRQYWNITKGIGICLVVLGHVCSDISNYIYLFHLPLFFFVSGFLYNEKKYGDDPFLNLSNRLKGLWTKYVVIYWVLILMHNLFAELGMLGVDAIVYSKLDIVYKLAEATLGMGQEIMGGTLWFVPVLVISSTILGFIVTLSRKLQRLTKSNTMKYLMQAVLIAVCGGAGYILSEKTIYLAANIQISLIVMPFLWIGYLISALNIDFRKFLNPFLAIIGGIALYYVSCNYRLDLALEFVYPLMHLVAGIGIYLCLYLVKLVQKIKILDYLFECLGKLSFVIMFAHFPMLRIIDWIYTICFNDCDFQAYAVMPVAYPQLMAIYLLVCIGVPLIIYMIYDCIVRKSKEHT